MKTLFAPDSFAAYEAAARAYLASNPAAFVFLCAIVAGLFATYAARKI